MSAAGLLIEELFRDLPTSLLRGELLGWLEQSPRLLEFAGRNRDKLRKKLRVARDAESLGDLRAELDVARCLLRDRRLELVYEPYASTKRRSPDFAATYRANTVFCVEVARLRVETEDAEPLEADLPRRHERVLRILLDKLSQCQPGMPNLLALHTAPALARALRLEELLKEVKRRAEGREAGFYALNRYQTPAEFFKDFSRLAGIQPWAAGAAGWANPQARPPLPPAVWRLLAAVLGE